MPLQDEQPSASLELRILRRADVGKKTGLKRAFIYKLMNEGEIPCISAARGTSGRLGCCRN